MSEPTTEEELDALLEEAFTALQNRAVEVGYNRALGDVAVLLSSGDFNLESIARLKKESDARYAAVPTPRVMVKP